MNILYVRWASFGADDIKEALVKLGHNVSECVLSDKAKAGIDDEFTDMLCSKIRLVCAWLVVSFNYYPSISEACMRTGCRYFAWIYDSPYSKLYDKSVANNVNYIGTFDSFTADELTKKGVSTVHYEPLAVNVSRVMRINGAYKNRTEIMLRTGSKVCFKDMDVEFVGSLYNNRNNFYERLCKLSNDMELMGFLDGVIEAQRAIYGYNFLDECIADDVKNRIRQFMPYKLTEGSYTSEERIYADYYLGPRMAFLDRTELLMGMSRHFKVALYSDGEFRQKNMVNYGCVDYCNEMPVIFNRTKINLNIALRSIRTGIPLRAMDIMGTGGFLLTNYQEDMFRHFEPGVHFDYYTSIEEAVDKVDYYLKHEAERSTIALTALKKMEESYTYEARLGEIISNITIEG